MLEVPKREIIINFLQFLLNFIILKHFNNPLIIQNKNPNYFFLKFLLNFIILKHFNYPRIIQNKNPNYFFLKFIINFIILKL
jgi:hypothetical protein